MKMMTSNINNLNLCEISGEKIKNNLIKFVQKKLNSNNVKLSIEHGSKKGENFNGEVYRILYGYANDENDESQLSLILKIAPQDSTRRVKLNSHGLFQREINMYEKVLSYFEEFQLSKGIEPNVNGFNESAKCYFSMEEELSECLFLEDLKQRNFELINHRTEPITFDHISLLMTALGKFHAISFALKDQQPDKFNYFKELLGEHHWTGLKKEYGFGLFFETFVNRLLNILKEKNRHDLVEKVKKKIGNDYMAFISNLVKKTSNDPHAVICHGDVTVFNSMFSKNEQGKPSEIRLFDWQFSCITTPIVDLVLYLFCSTTKEFRNQNYENLLKIYHSSFTNLLKRFGSDPDKLFPYNVLLDQFRNYNVYTIFVGALLLPMLCADVETMPKGGGFDKGITDDIFRISDESKPAYNMRVLDIFIDLARLGHI